MNGQSQPQGTLDLRPAAVRLLTARWQQVGPRGGGFPARVLTRLVDAWQAHRAVSRPEPRGAELVVSIGNLALGGTGKTPVTARLALDLATAGLRGAVLTRGYGSGLAGPVQVTPGTVGAGDEARFLAGLLAEAGWVVVQARRRARGLDWLAARAPGLDVLLVEDGHQTAGVGRHLDVLLVSPEPHAPPGSLWPEAGPVAPFGPWRESAAGASRAGVWLLEAGGALPVGPPGVSVAGFRRQFRLGEGLPAAGPVALLSGIARPAGFEAEARRLIGDRACLAIRCRDHEPYDRRMLARLDRALAACGAVAVVTTAKDRVKLAAAWDSRPVLVELEMDVRWEGTPALPDLVRERLDAVRRGWPAR